MQIKTRPAETPAPKCPKSGKGVEKPGRQQQVETELKLQAVGFVSAK
jgi:hypothetical protein